ncbi:hypothetical protein QTH90_28710 [Variovorax sp. J2P1-59]|uniref:hypothetical protein n=1 Tax=Variovorax flavidus TaxID=3053501 RepID=UPI002574B4EC|nr:hypothetical protein [Variovorax sp. J2P1-59]MDM0078419.1 hypothetical protein [Variovorax sp. J2P1-59]
MDQLRRLSVFVDEPQPGHFHWVLHESTEDATVWVDIESSAEPYPTWNAAFEVGVTKLYHLIGDERVGPRVAGEDEGAAPVG